MSENADLYFDRLLDFLANRRCEHFEYGRLELCFDIQRSKRKGGKYFCMKRHVADGLSREYALEDPIPSTILDRVIALMATGVKVGDLSYMVHLANTFADALEGVVVQILLPTKEVLSDDVQLSEFDTLQETMDNSVAPVVYCKKLEFQSPTVDLIRLGELFDRDVIEQMFKIAKGERIPWKTWL